MWFSRWVYINSLHEDCTMPLAAIMSDQEVCQIKQIVKRLIDGHLGGLTVGVAPLHTIDFMQKQTLVLVKPFCYQNLSSIIYSDPLHKLSDRHLAWEFRNLILVN